MSLLLITALMLNASGLCDNGPFTEPPQFENSYLSCHGWRAPR